MRRIIYIATILLTTTFYGQAQIDRSVQPEPGPAPKINLQKPKEFSLANGLTVLVVENHKLPRVTFSLSLDNPRSVEGDIKGVYSLTSSMMGNGTAKISKEDFNGQIDYYGASVSFSVNNISGSSLSRYFPQILSLAAHGALEPLFTQEELDSEKAKLLDALKSNERNVPAIARRVNNLLLYGKNHPNGEYATEETVNRVTLADVQDYYRKYFVPQNAYLVVVGDVKFDEVKNLVTESFSSWKHASAPKGQYPKPANLTHTEIDFVDMPNAVQTEVFVGNITNLRMTSPNYFAALMANQILGGGSDGRLFMNLREGHGWTYGAYSSINGSKYISHFGISSSVKSTAADSAIVEIIKELERIRETVPTQKDLDLAKAKYLGSFVMNAEKPQTIAGFALRVKTQKLPSDFYENYIANIDAVTLEQVQEAAQKYMLNQGVRIVIVGKASEILNKLEGLNIPVKYYDKYGNPVPKPEE